MKTLFILICCCTPTLFCQTSIEQISFLEGTWKVENKEQYEAWNLTDSTTLEGYAYTLKDGNKSITETVTISTEEDNIIYKASVPNQNNGTTIPFILNKDIVAVWSFENETHDFPKKIIYKKRNETTIEVSVLGNNDIGFSYKMIKQ